MSPDILNRVTPDDLTLYFIGGVVLIIMPPLVGLIATWLLFAQPPEDGRALWRRLLLIAFVCLLLAGGLGFLGVYLLEPASPQAVWLTLLIAFIFGLLGAGKLYWRDEENRDRQ